MRKCPVAKAKRAKILRIACALALAATAAACDRCGDFPIRLQGDQLDACRDEAPRQR